MKQKTVKWKDIEKGAKRYFIAPIVLGILSAILGLSVAGCYLGKLNLSVNDERLYSAETIKLYNLPDYYKSNNRLMIDYIDTSNNTKFICWKSNGSPMYLRFTGIYTNQIDSEHSDNHYFEIGRTFSTVDTVYIDYKYNSSGYSNNATGYFKNYDIYWKGSRAEEAENIYRTYIEPTAKKFFNAYGIKTKLSRILQDKLNAYRQYEFAEIQVKTIMWVLIVSWGLMSLAFLIVFSSSSSRRRAYLTKEYLKIYGITNILSDIGMAYSDTHIFVLENNVIYKSKNINKLNVSSTEFNLGYYTRQMEDKTHYFKLGLASALTGVGVISDFQPRYYGTLTYVLSYRINHRNGTSEVKEFSYELSDKLLYAENCRRMESAIRVISLFRVINNSICEKNGKVANTSKILEQAEIGMQNILKSY